MRANARKHIGGYAKISSEGAINIRLKAALAAGQYAMTHMPGTIRKSSGGGFAENRKEMNRKDGYVHDWLSCNLPINLL